MEICIKDISKMVGDTCMGGKKDMCQHQTYAIFINL